MRSANELPPRRRQGGCSGSSVHRRRKASENCHWGGRMVQGEGDDGPVVRVVVVQQVVRPASLGERVNVLVGRTAFHRNVVVFHLVPFVRKMVVTCFVGLVGRNRRRSCCCLGIALRGGWCCHFRRRRRWMGEGDFHSGWHGNSASIGGWRKLRKDRQEVAARVGWWQCHGHRNRSGSGCDSSWRWYRWRYGGNRAE